MKPIIYIFLSILLIQIIGSCGVFFPYKREPIAKICFFDPIKMRIVYNKENGSGIKRIEIEVFSSEKKIYYSYYKQNYSKSMKTIDLSLMDTTMFKTNRLLIKIWDNSPVIENYSIEINPLDWQLKKLVYSRFSIR